MQILLEHDMFLYDTYAKYNSYKKCCHKFRFPDALVPDGEDLHFFLGT
jgi:hypothetical protein